MSTTHPLDALAQRIKAHLHRFEADPAINAAKVVDGRERIKPYFNAGAHRHSGRVSVCYVSFQGSSLLTTAEAEHYVAALDAGFVGRHHSALRTWKPPEGTPTCAGCGKVGPEYPATFSLGPGREVTVCGNKGRQERRHQHLPKKPTTRCRRLVLEVAPMYCPGCGDPFDEQGPAFQVCYECRRVLDAAKAVPQDAEWWTVDAERVLPYLPDSGDAAWLAECLAHAVSVEPVGGGHGGYNPGRQIPSTGSGELPRMEHPPWGLRGTRSRQQHTVALPPGRAFFLQSAIEAIGYLMAGAEAKGHEAGSNLLRRLSAGEITMDSLNDANAAAVRRMTRKP